jgi:hypothetical protein
VARDIAAAAARAVSAGAIELRAIAARRRCKVARDIATTLSHESSTFSAHSADFGGEAGA